MPNTNAVVDYAREELNFSGLTLAQEKPEALVSTMVGMDRIHLFHRIAANMERALSQRSLFDIACGNYGSGKSHLALLVKANTVHSYENTLVISVKLTSALNFRSMLATLLRNVLYNGTPSENFAGVELNAYTELYRRAGTVERMREVINSCAFGIDPNTITELHLALCDLCSQTPTANRILAFIPNFFERSGSDFDAMNLFLSIMRMFRAVGIEQLVIIADEFESVQSCDEPQQRAYLQSFQNLLENFSAEPHAQTLPRTYGLFFSTRLAWNGYTSLLPSLRGRIRPYSLTGDPKQDYPELQPMTSSDIKAMVYRLVYIAALAYPTKSIVTDTEINDICEYVLANMSVSTVRDIKSFAYSYITEFFANKN